MPQKQNKKYEFRFWLIFQCSEDAWDKIFDVNVKASFLLAKLVAPHMMKKEAGSIVFISSIGGFHPIPVRQKKI